MRSIVVYLQMAKRIFSHEVFGCKLKHEGELWRAVEVHSWTMVIVQMFGVEILVCKLLNPI